MNVKFISEIKLTGMLLPLTPVPVPTSIIPRGAPPSFGLGRTSVRAKRICPEASAVALNLVDTDGP